jgi:hypothetical protein
MRNLEYMQHPTQYEWSGIGCLNFSQNIGAHKPGQGLLIYPVTGYFYKALDGSKTEKNLEFTAHVVLYSIVGAGTGYQIF